MVSASIGTASFPDDGATAEDVLLAADRACFVAKRRGRGPGRDRRPRASPWPASSRCPSRRRSTRRARRPPDSTRRSCPARRHAPGAITAAAGLRHNRAAGRLPVNRSVRRARARPALAAVLGAVLAIAIAGLPARLDPPDARADPDARARPDDAAPARRPTPGPPTPTPGPSFKLYKVSRGDTLTWIARRFQTSTRSLSPTGTARSTRRWTRRARTTGRTGSSGAGRSRCCRARSTSPPPDDGETGDPGHPDAGRRHRGLAEPTPRPPSASPSP